MDPFYLIVGSLLLIASSSIFLLVYGQKKNKELKVQLLESLNPMKHRLDMSNISAHIEKIPYSKAKLHIEDTIEKFSLIDSIADLEPNISNYSTFITLLENASLTDVRSNIESARAQIERSQFLVGKYGEEIARKLIDNDYFLGMTEDQLIDSRGKPSKIETEVMKTKTKVIYIYGNKSSGDVFNFVNGELERFTDR